MSTRKGTGYFAALFLAFSLLCSVSLVAQDKVLTNNSINPAAKSATADPTSVNCTAYDSTGLICVAGQYFHSDNTVPSATWTPMATATSFGPWAEGTLATNPNVGCLACHHGTVNSTGTGGGYLVGGHKNVLRKIVPGQTLLDTQGNAITTLSNHDSATHLYTLNSDGTVLDQPTNKTYPAYFAIGWYAGSTTGVYGDNTQNGNTTVYGSCARCHTTGYRPDANGPEPTVVTPATSTTPAIYTPLTDAQLGRVPAGSVAPATSSWSLTGIQCERCHKLDMQVDPKFTAAATGGRIAHHNIGDVSGAIRYGIVPSDGKDYTVNPYQIPGTDLTLKGTPGLSVKASTTGPNALLCIECHQAAATWTAKTAGKAGQVHLTPLPGFESLATPLDTANFTSTKLATGQFTATFACSVASITTKTADYYNACIKAGGSVTYVPGGMSHGAVATILNSPHARVTGYVDYKNPGTADNNLTIIGGKFNTFFASPLGISGSCMGCHNIHGDMTTYKGFNPPNGPAVNATNVDNPLTPCGTCHASHKNAMNHPTGPGTPFAALPNTDGTGTFGSQESCSTCHISNKSGTLYHFLRINPKVDYNTFPSAAQYYTTAGSGQFGKLNTYNENYTDTSDYSTKIYPAVGLDVDIACGQCHTGGDGTKSPYGLTPYAGDGGVTPRPYSRAFLAAAAVSMHNTNAAAPTFTATDNFLTQGTVTTNGTKVTWISGTSFPIGNSWVNQQFVIGGITYTVASVTNATTLVLTTSAGIQTSPVMYFLQTYTTALPLPSTGGPTSIAITSPSISEGAYASIFYTTDGTIPTATVNAAEAYVAGGTTKVATGGYVLIPVTATTTIYAFAAGPASYSFTPSAMVGGTYTMQVAPKPVITPSNGNIVGTTPISVKITTGLSAALIAYNTDGVTWKMYSAPISVSSPTVIQARVIAVGYAPSPVVTATFTGTALAPAFSLNGGSAKYPGTYTGAVAVYANLTDAAPALCYTLNGTTPVVTAGVCVVPAISVVPGANIAISASATIKAVAYGNGFSASKVTSGTYVIR